MAGASPCMNQLPLTKWEDRLLAHGFVSDPEWRTHHLVMCLCLRSMANLSNRDDRSLILDSADFHPTNQSYVFKFNRWKRIWRLERLQSESFNYLSCSGGGNSTCPRVVRSPDLLFNSDPPRRFNRLNQPVKFVLQYMDRGTQYAESGRHRDRNHENRWMAHARI
jgi:hypothetical protein